MSGLTVQKKKYLIILHAIWKLLTYYSMYFNLDVPDDPTKLNVGIVRHDDNVTHITVTVRCPRKVASYFFLREPMKPILNEYLNIVLLPQYKELPPFAAGKSYDEVVDCLYVYSANYGENGYTYIDLIYVDNMQAYQAVRRDQKIQGITI